MNLYDDVDIISFIDKVKCSAIRIRSVQPQKGQCSHMKCTVAKRRTVQPQEGLFSHMKDSAAT